MLIRVFFTIVAVGLVGCGKQQDPTLLHTSEQTTIPKVRFDSSVPSDQQGYLSEDIRLIARLRFSSATAADAQILDLRDLSPSQLSTWVSNRLSTIVGESFNWKEELTSESGEPIPISSSESDDSSKPKTVTVMENTGGVVYLLEKAFQKQYGEPVVMGLEMDWGPMIVRSPRVGIIRIGKGLFNTTPDKTQSLSSLGNRLLRIAVVFHELRHTDGRGSNTAFAHVKCSSGKLKGVHNCDQHSNGPFGVEAVILRNSYETCSSCTNSEKQKIRTYLSEALSRIEGGASFGDATPESL